MSATTGILGFDCYHGDGFDEATGADSLDFSAAQEAGAYWCALKATQGGHDKDPAYTTRRAKANGTFNLVVSFHFGTGDATGTEQGNNFLNQIGWKLNPGECVAFDLEPDASWKGVGPDQVAQILTDFIYTVKTALGLSDSDFILYGDAGDLENLLGAHWPSFKAFMIYWQASWGTLPDPQPSIWQSAENWPAISPSTVDLDYWLNLPLFATISQNPAPPGVPVS